MTREHTDETGTHMDVTCAAQGREHTHTHTHTLTLTHTHTRIAEVAAPKPKHIRVPPYIIAITLLLC